ncbi:MAG: MBL fold metallo-hydrolase [Ruminococcus sp.]|nr:MBL fold metallo-hydrolase [Ruminococcus sp.]
MELDHITVNTQSSIRIAGSKILYFDPFQIGTETHDADIIFITHEHYDHFEPDSIEKIKKENTVLAAPESMRKKVLSEAGIAPEHCVFYNPGETHKLEDITIETIPAYNKLKPFHPKAKKWQGYIVTMDDIRYYVAGDTDVNEDIRKVRCDVALLPVGGHFTMDKKQAADYIAELKPKSVIPTHYGSIVGSKTDGQEFQAYLEKLDKEIQVELRI